MAFMIEMTKRLCITCSKEVYGLFRTQEEYDNFQCQDCLDFIVYLNKIESYLRED